VRRFEHPRRRLRKARAQNRRSCREEPAMPISDRALRLIIDFEGINQPGQWPGASSGITLGYGYDLGHVTADQFERDWGACFTPSQKARLRASIGKTGAAAAALAPSLADIKCNRADSARVLSEVSIPDYLARTRAAFPGLEALPPDAQGALVSLVYNRGAGMSGDSRREMRTIRALVPLGDLPGIAAALRQMKRLWEGKGLAGLLRRRDAEASLIEAAMAPIARRLRRVAKAGAAWPGQVGGAVGRAARRAGKAVTAGKLPAKKAAAKKSATKKPAAKKSAAMKADAKKSPAKKATPKKVAAKKSAVRKPAAKKAVAKKASAKRPAKKAAAKKSSVKRPAAKKVTVKKATAKKRVASKPAAKKSSASKRAAPRPAARKAAAQRALIRRR
jgi:GH24 family phage-related lysozyme (muramidase)